MKSSAERKARERIIRNLQVNRSIINPVFPNAIGDGVADDTSAVNAALTKFARQRNIGFDSRLSSK